LKKYYKSSEPVEALVSGTIGEHSIIGTAGLELVTDAPTEAGTGGVDGIVTL
jgi:hypothetical protein